MGSHVQFYRDDAGEWRWRVRDDNGNVTGDSAEGYKNRADCEAGWVNVTNSEWDS